MKLPESQSKALEEAAEEYSSLTSPSFIAGAHHQHPISYAHGIKDVIELMASNVVESNYQDHYFRFSEGQVAFLEKHFSTELKSLENGGKE